jgi:hypothetical protein
MSKIKVDTLQTTNGATSINVADLAGLGAASPEQTSTTDYTDGRLLKVGAFGLGNTTNVQYPQASLDTSDVPSGMYRVTSAVGGTWPIAAFTGCILVERTNGNVIKQTLSQTTTDREWTRTVNTNVPSAWAEKWDSINTPKQTSVSDATAGRVLLNGAFGLGATNVIISSTDLNDLSKTGFYMGTTLTNSPENIAGWLYITHQEHNPSWSTQTAQTLTLNPVKYVRSKLNGIWSIWYKEFSQWNILGTVSQSGGVPTGSIIERGSNSNGEYVMFADGTMICTRQIFLASLGAAVSYTTGLNRYAFTWTYPAVFSSASAVSGSGTDQTAVGFIGGLGSSSGSSSVHQYITPTNGLTSVTIRVVAIGRWFE